MKDQPSQEPDSQGLPISTMKTHSPDGLWIGQTPLDIYCEVLGLSPGTDEVARIIDSSRDTLEILGNVGHFAFLKSVAHNLHYQVGRFTIERWWLEVQARGKHVLMAARNHQSEQHQTASRPEVLSPTAPEEVTASACEKVLREWERNPPPLRFALARAREIGDVPNSDGFRCLVQLVGWISRHYLDAPLDLTKVAHEMVRAYVLGATSLVDLAEIARRGSRHAESVFDARLAQRVTDDLENNIVLLLDSNESVAVAKLSKNLRKYGRPDLSIEATENFSAQQAGWDVVWTSRAAAFTDLDRLDEALAACRDIWAKKPTAAVCTVRSRVYRLRQNHQESQRWALEGWKLDENVYTARTLAASSALIGDTKHLQDAAEHLEWSEAGASEGTEVDPFVLVKAGWVLLNDGNIDEARNLALQVLVEHNGYRRAGALLSAANQQDALRGKTS